MFDLFLSELRRFHRFTLAAALGHLLALLLGHFNNFHAFEVEGGLQAAYMMGYTVFPVLLAIFQLYGFHSQQRWQWLMHRPLARPAIFGALALAAAAQIVFIVALPLLLAALGTDFLTFRTIDLRHYLWILFVAEICIIAWLVFATVSFSARWSSIVIVILPGILLGHRTTAIFSVLLAGATLILYTYIAYSNFKPDRKAPPSGLRANIAVALPLVIGIFILLFVVLVTAFGLQMKFAAKKPAKQAIASATHDPVAGMESAKRMKNLVARSKDPRSDDWLRELEVAPVYPVFQTIHTFAKRQQLLNDYAPTPYVTPRRVLWSFDHDDMRFVGIDVDTGEFREARGLHGKGDLTPFPSVPRAGLDYLVLPQQIRAFDSHAMLYPLRAVFTAPEVVSSEPKRIGRRLYVRSNQRLIAYHADRLNADGMFIELFSIPLPEDRGHTPWIDVAPLEGTTLIYVGYGMKESGGRTYVHQLHAVDRYDQVAPLHDLRRPVPAQDLSAISAVGWVVSPGLHTALLSIGLTGYRPSEALERAANDLRPPVGWIALAVLILSGLFAWLWLRDGKRGPALAWTAACIVVGPPALLTLILLYPRQRLLVRN